MRLVIQRVTQAKVEIDGRLVGQCAKGFMILVGAQVGDTMDDVKYTVDELEKTVKRLRSMSPLFAESTAKITMI